MSLMYYIHRNDLNDLLPFIKNHQIITVNDKLVFITELTPFGDRQFIDANYIDIDRIDEILEPFSKLIAKGIHVQVHRFGYDETKETIAFERTPRGINWKVSYFKALDMIGCTTGIVPTTVFEML